MGPSLVWYASYGSNMSAARFGCYLAGGQAAGALRAHEGCSDPSPPVADRPLWLAGQMYFALEARLWTGGLALYDPDTPGPTAARAYLVTESQLADLVAQEMHRTPEVGLCLPDVPRGGRLALGDGRYETLVDCGDLDGYRVLTLAAPWPVGDVTLSAPSAAYVRTVATGLAEAHGWGVGQVVEYLLERPGVRPQWSAEALTDQCGGLSCGERRTHSRWSHLSR